MNLWFAKNIKKRILSQQGGFQVSKRETKGGKKGIRKGKAESKGTAP
jgi:hypothetical protein